MSNSEELDVVKVEAISVFKQIMDLIQTSHLDKDIVSLMLTSAVLDFLIVGWAIDSLGEEKTAEVHTSCSILAPDVLKEALEEMSKDLGINVKSDSSEN